LLDIAYKMKIAQIQFTSWDKIYDFAMRDIELSKDDKVVVKSDSGMEIGTVIAFREIPKNDLENYESILRKANVHDLEKMLVKNEKKEALLYARQMKDKYGLSMKFIDVHFSFDGSKITFAFIADGRVDFRELVKDLTRHFGKSIRLQQIGIRDEAKIMGDCGHCGRPLCCQGHLSNLVSITSEMAEIQECSHRGSDRISGICGRLMCCLAYEQHGYEQLSSEMPKMGAKVNVDGRKGIIVRHHLIKRSVDVEFPDENKKGETVVLEVDLDRNKKNKKSE
jgi:cell fate regulator YaaT (PSP1 superfamily)